MSEQFKTLPERIQALSDATSCSSFSLTSVEQTKGFQIIAFVDSCFGDSQCEIDACGLIAAMLIAFAKARSDPFTISLWLKSSKHQPRAVVLHHSKAPIDAGSRASSSCSTGWPVVVARRLPAA